MGVGGGLLDALGFRAFCAFLRQNNAGRSVFASLCASRWGRVGAGNAVVRSSCRK